MLICMAGMFFRRFSLARIRQVGKTPREAGNLGPPKEKRERGAVAETSANRFRALLGLCLMVVSISPRAQALQLPAAQPEEVGMSGQRLEQLDRVVKDAIRNGETPGAVVLVGRRGKIVYRKAFGDRAREPQPEPMTVDTIFDVASMTKVMATATSILILVEEGRISLTDRVAQYLPDFAEHDKGRITILQLLTHFSGLRPDLDLDEPWEGYETGVEKALGERLVAVPGSEFIYSDINYIVLAEIVRVASGRHLHEFSFDRVFKPLGLKRTRFLPPSQWSAETAPTEYRQGKLMRGSVHDPTAFRMGGCTGHAGLFSTVDDTAVFAQMILNGECSKA